MRLEPDLDSIQIYNESGRARSDDSHPRAAGNMADASAHEVMGGDEATRIPLVGDAEEGTETRLRISRAEEAPVEVLALPAKEQRDLAIKAASQRPVGWTKPQCGVLSVTLALVCAALLGVAVWIDWLDLSQGICTQSRRSRIGNESVDSVMFRIVFGLSLGLAALAACMSVAATFGMPVPPQTFGEVAAPAPWPEVDRVKASEDGRFEGRGGVAFREFVSAERAASPLRDSWRPVVQFFQPSLTAFVLIWAVVEALPVVGLAGGFMGLGNSQAIATCNTTAIAVAVILTNTAIIWSIGYGYLIAYAAVRGCCRFTCPRLARSLYKPRPEDLEEDERRAREAERLAEQRARAEKNVALRELLAEEGAHGPYSLESTPTNDGKSDGTTAGVSSMLLLATGALERDVGRVNAELGTAERLAKEELAKKAQEAAESAAKLEAEKAAVAAATALDKAPSEKSERRTWLGKSRRSGGEKSRGKRNEDEDEEAPAAATTADATGDTLADVTDASPSRDVTDT
jgi:hypothetical protein